MLTPFNFGVSTIVLKIGKLQVFFPLPHYEICKGMWISLDSTVTSHHTSFQLPSEIALRYTLLYVALIICQ